MTVPDPAADRLPLEAGLEPAHRFRCDACGNLTRFDVIATERTRRYHHADLGGRVVVEEDEVLDRTVERVTCRWCGRSDTVTVERAPVAASGPSSDPSVGGGSGSRRS